MSLKASYTVYQARKCIFKSSKLNLRALVSVFTRVADLLKVGRACVTRGDQHLLYLRRLGQLPGQRVLPSSAADHQHLLCHGA